MLMLTLSTRHQILIGLGLIALLITTRSQHFATLTQLPGAAWAVFFLAGVYLRPAWIAVALFALVWAIDFSVITWGGVSNFCFTSAYAFLVPAYGALWLAGRWYAQQYQFSWSNLMPLIGSVLLAAIACELLSSGGFYFFSDRFAATSLTEFGLRLSLYFPASLQALLLYVGIAAAVHSLMVLASGTAKSKAAAVR